MGLHLRGLRLGKSFYQLGDDGKDPDDNRKPSHRVGALYDFFLLKIEQRLILWMNITGVGYW